MQRLQRARAGHRRGGHRNDTLEPLNWEKMLIDHGSEYEEFSSILERWSSFGSTTYPDGTRLIGKVGKPDHPIYGHSLFGPLSAVEVECLETSIQLEFPDGLRQFYLRHNGCILFRGALPVYGLRRSYDRSDIQAMVCNPFELRIPALTLKAISPSQRGIALSRYRDETHVFIEPTSIVVRTNEAGRVLNRWETFDRWLTTEAARMTGLFGPLGEMLVEPEMTAPASSWAD